MKLSRRTLLITGVASFSASRLWAVTVLDLGDFTLRSISDGALTLPVSMLASDGRIPDGVSGSTFEAPLNVTVMQRNDQVILFDSGCGADFMPGGGLMPQALSAIGISADQVTHVLFTHAHPDHLWGAVDEFDKPRFPKARYLMSRIERDFWTDPAVLDQLDDIQKPFAAGTAHRIEVLGEKLETFEHGDMIVDGIVARPTPGHTPGHTAFVVDGKIMVTGDVLSHVLTSFRTPELPTSFDHDPKLAAQTRLNLLEQLSNSGMPLIGYHLPAGGIGQVEADGNAYRFINIRI